MREYDFMFQYLKQTDRFRTLSSAESINTKYWWYLQGDQ